MDICGGKAALLPKVKPLGEFDDDLDIFSGLGADELNIPTAISPMERQIILGRLILEWTKHLQRNAQKQFGEEDIAIPVSTADAFWLATDLGNLIDQFQSQNRSIKAAADAVESTKPDVSDWWNVTMSFLQVVESEWPALLASRNAIDPSDRRNRLLLTEAKRLRESQPEEPYLVAGSTGSIAATAELMSAIARLPNGAVILPGYDQGLSSGVRSHLRIDNPAPGDISHPQYGLEKLLQRIGADASIVERLGPQARSELNARGLWVGGAMSVADETAQWSRLRQQLPDTAFKNVVMLSAPNEARLADAIAISIREKIKDPLKRAALVTPDRGLARRVIMALAAHGIQADDSAGTPFANTQPGRLVTALLDLVFRSDDPATALGLLKHQYVVLGLSRADHQHSVTRFEHIVMRGGLGRFKPGYCTEFVITQLSMVAEDDRRSSDLSPKDIETITAFAQRFDNALSPLTSLLSKQSVNVQACLEATITALEALCRNDEGSLGSLYDAEAGSSLSSFLVGLASIDEEVTFPPDQWPEIIGSLSAGSMVREVSDCHPRVFIWGALEARLQYVDHIILGGLNEGIWPQVPETDAFITRTQMAAIGMEPPERRVGLSAHDFQMAMGQPSVVLARSKRVEGTPTVASRWWQRLEAFAGPDASAEMNRRGARLLDMATDYSAASQTTPIGRPYPKPPAEVRPKALSVTNIEKLIADPYAIYAQKVLGLKKVEPLVRDPDARDRGTLFHEIMERSVTECIDFSQEDANRDLKHVAEDCFKDANLPEEIRAMWWPRFEALIPEIINWERGRNKAVKQRHAEITASSTALEQTGVSIHGRADRVDERDDGSLDLIDFKSSNVPSKPDLEKLKSVQLSLEAALAARGAFRDLGKRNVTDIAYVKMGPRGKFEVKPAISLADEKHADLAEKAWGKAVQLADAYNCENTGYRSKARASASKYEGDYDHLARVSEWGSGGGGDE